jgi:hypothetical protein
MLEKRTLMACEGVVALGAMAWLAVPEQGITVLYFMLMFTAAGLIAQLLQALWREQSGDRGVFGGASANQLHFHQRELAITTDLTSHLRIRPASQFTRNVSCEVQSEKSGPTQR